MTDLDEWITRLRREIEMNKIKGYRISLCSSCLNWRKIVHKTPLGGRFCKRCSEGKRDADFEMLRKTQNQRLMERFPVVEDR